MTSIVTDATNADLKNPWGMAPSEGFFWIANEGSGFVSVLSPDGRQSDEYPAHRFCLGDGITGVAHLVGLAADAFMINTGGSTQTQAEFIVANSNGTLIAINDNAPSAGVKVVDSSAKGAVYLGVALIASSSGPELLAADFKNARIDVFDSKFKPVVMPANAFVDPSVPKGYGAFNVMSLGSSVYVSWAKQEDDNPGEEQHGAGLGFVSIFNAGGTLLTHIDNTQFNAPWGMAIMDTRLSGTSASTLLVGNLGDGHITAFDATTHAQLGQLNDASGAPLAIDGLWSIVPGSADAGVAGTLYFTAGPNEEKNGMFGRINAN